LQEIAGGIEVSVSSENPQHLLARQKVMEIDLTEDGILLVRVPPPQTTDTAGGRGSECFIRPAPTQHV